ncbi:MAG: amylo-alpha-1,6-glucosidase [Bryobacteraceae bacterium]|nr:amylo-alpha-1,6-glucosidase [Bryobacteraceae bacterium]
MPELVRRMSWSASQAAETEPLLSREWLVTNGLGGYASGTLAGVITRRYHGLLVAALPTPLGRIVMLSDLVEHVMLPGGQEVALGGEERPDRLQLHGSQYLTEFRLEKGLPVWRFEALGCVIERSLLLVQRQNTVHVTYTMLEGEGSLRLNIRPVFRFRPYEAPVTLPLSGSYGITVWDHRHEFAAGPELPPLRTRITGDCGAFTVDRRTIEQVLYRIEESRGYESRGDLWSPGYFHVDLTVAQPATLIASTEPWESIDALAPEQARRAELLRRERLLIAAPPAACEGMGAELVLAADQFLMKPAGRQQEAARAAAAGDEIRSVIAGYHWFTDWGRDTMISLEGLTLCTGRHSEAGWILRTFGQYVKNGLIPNFFPDGKSEGLYHTADATLWFFHAMDRYLRKTDDRLTLRLLLPVFKKIAEAHLRGTDFGIRVDPADGLLRQGEEGYQLTWMDAKVDGWVVTPRRGKAVEINALWYNALRVLANWVCDEEGDGAQREWQQHAERARESFNRRFWFARGGYLYDIVDGEGGDDSALRPNQVLAISLPYPVLDARHWEQVMKAVRENLLTPDGLRSLAPSHPDYKARYYGDLRSRDAAYHQGTVWGWLIGPYVDAWLKLHPEDKAGARELLKGFEEHLGEAGVGTISEIFDAEEPFTPRGCIAQAWSVAEVLRSWVNTSP